ncbi:MAG: MBOAT family O-acyltransferase [Bacillota bacterium]|nr:MBOAT family O-acyltransferase [Bacillota bacterium]
MSKLSYILPIGISFYTFKALSYVIDVYRDDCKAEKNIVKYALYVSFFPQIVSGPIQRANDFISQINEKHTYDYDRIKNGLVLILWGLFQKMVVADRLAILVNTVFSNPSHYHGFEVITASIFFTFQIYIDFSAYSNMSIGIAQVLGYKVSANFLRPYFSKSIKEFWRRWHISLSTWFKDYLYIPLGGNRCSKFRYYFNIMVVFILSGLWHGSAFTFIIWGALHGIYQIIGNILKPLKKLIVKSCNININSHSYKLLKILITFALVNFAWIFFRASSFKAAVILIKNMMYFNPQILINGSIFKLGLNSSDFVAALIGICVIIIVDIIQISGSVRDKLSNKKLLFRWGIYISSIVIILILGIYGPGYDIQQFIYSKF